MKICRENLHASESIFREKALGFHFIRPQVFKKVSDDTYFADFGKHAFGTLVINLNCVKTSQTILVRLGEKLDDKQMIDRNPPGSIRYYECILKLVPGESQYIVDIPPNAGNTGKFAIKMPKNIGEVMPFRYCEICKVQEELYPGNLSQRVVFYPFNDDAANFRSSDADLNKVWDLCKYSIKAMNFCGLYIDGDRERIPYEGDAYINQLSHYAVDNEYSIARRTHEYLITHPTWFSEWFMNSIFMAWADYMYSGDITSLKKYYIDLQVKTLMHFSRKDCLLEITDDKMTDEILESLHAKRKFFDLVDWPPGSFTNGGTGERDNHEMLPVNSVINAVHYRSLILMGEISKSLGCIDEAGNYQQRADNVQNSFNRIFFNKKTGLYVDGEGSTHSSLHSNMFPLAFNMVPENSKQRVIDFVVSKGMACSVYGAQYLLEALFENNRADEAISLMTANHDRSWMNMIKSGATITTEAWDWKYKNNLDWNHAWATAPLNIINRFLIGINPLKPGLKEISINPQIGNLSWIEANIPTVNGPISLKIRKSIDNKAVIQELQVPSGIKVTNKIGNKHIIVP